MHTIEPTKETLHGYWSRERDPVLTIQPGDTVRYRTLDAKWNAYDPDTETLVKSPLREQDPLQGHALCGPVYIDGAQPGMTLEIRTDAIETAPLGWNWSGGEPRPLWERLGVAEPPLFELTWTLDNAACTATSNSGFTTKLVPFMGVMGMPPDAPGNHTTRPPYVHGGNIDCKMLTVGSRLYLPVPVEGALFSAGDGHAAQGDGEASIYAIECPMERVDLTFHLHDDMPLSTPRALTDEGWVTLGFDEDLDEAMLKALDAMLDLMTAQLDVSRKEALALASVAVDLRITQIVNTVQGVHAVLPKDALSHRSL